MASIAIHQFGKAIDGFHNCRYSVSEYLDHPEQQVASIKELEFPERGFVVDLRDGQKSCQCGQFQEHGVPCTHVLAFTRSIEKDAQELVPYCLTVPALRACYAENFPPLGIDIPALPDNQGYACFAPDLKRAKGRPRKRRVRLGDYRKRLGKRRQREILQQIERFYAVPLEVEEPRQLRLLPGRESSQHVRKEIFGRLGIVNAEFLCVAYANNRDIMLLDAGIDQLLGSLTVEVAVSHTFSS
ncbi:hypothetical protein BJ508DRAFT_302698 [Ascobolus immersus RN42]|uniref:SWIM-type domain-containing protein n=1 Tax=Ascobolus immersus RN42 TaxID=1160509 RepID=A0A3N4IIB8_ASCIM|nr:hypothetical protein BJ508DRAFT_302698 [Ascobolus immersus RN42]